MGLSSIYLAQLTDQEPCRFQVDRPRTDAVKRPSAVTPLGDTDCLLSGRLLPRVRQEQALPEAALAELTDQGLRCRGHQEVGERAATRDVDARGILRIQLEHVVDVVQARVAFDHRDELELVAPREIGRAVGDRVGSLLVGHLQRLAHPVSGLGVPITGARPDTGDAPQLLLDLVGPRLIATGDERRFTLRDPRQRRDRVALAAQALWFSWMPDAPAVALYY